MVLALKEFDFKEVLAEKKAIIWKEYQKYLVGKTRPAYSQDRIQDYREEDAFFWKTISDYPERQGKYVRGALILLVCEAMGVDQKKAALTGAAMQASEDWILIHDDLEDCSPERRGKPSLQRVFGEAQAINAGDALHILMWKMLRDNEKILGTKKTFRVMDEMNNMLMRTTLGQSVEIKWIEENKLDLSDDDVFFVIGGKTTYYTICGPLRLGGIIAGLDEKQMSALFEFGVPLGRCFQIKDDLLDITSDFEGLKKQVGNDIYEGKRTLMLMHLLRKANEEDLGKIMAILKKKRQEKSEAEVKFVISKMHEYGSIRYGEEKAEELKNQAFRVFDEKLGFLGREPGRSKLRTAIGFILERKK
ncbi:MAG: polyprenyl synthetase family protein [archaeon]